MRNLFILLAIFAGVLMSRRAIAAPFDMALLGTPDENKKLFLPYISSAEQFNGIPSGILFRLIDQESKFRTDVIIGEAYSDLNKNGYLDRQDAQGIAQIVPRWHPNVDPLEPVQAIEYAAWYLASLYAQFGSWEAAAGAYNWGPTHVQEAINDYGAEWLAHAPKETQNYVEKIV